jgi:hypothetical protein
MTCHKYYFFPSSFCRYVVNPQYRYIDVYIDSFVLLHFTVKRTKIDSPSPCRSACISEKSPLAVSPKPKEQKKTRFTAPPLPRAEPSPSLSRAALPSSWSDDQDLGANLFDDIAPKADPGVNTPRVELFPSETPVVASSSKSTSKYSPAYFCLLFYEPLPPDHPIYKKLSKRVRPAGEPDIFSITIKDFV